MSDDRQPPADAADFAALGAQLGRLRSLPVPPGLEARLLAAMPLGSRPRRPRLLRWVPWLAGTAVACLLVGVLAWQAGRNDRPAIVADRSLPSMAVRGPATRPATMPAAHNLGVQLAYHRNSDGGWSDSTKIKGKVGDNFLGRFGDEGLGGGDAVAITNDKGRFASNTAGCFASTQPGDAIVDRFSFPAAGDGGEPALAGGPVNVTREAQADRVVLDNANVLRGSILNESYEITTAFGKLTVPADRIAGLAPAGGSRTWLVLADGQRLLGQLADPGVRISLSGGATVTIPLARIRQAGYRLDA
ncbi:MAG: hypothetical protein WCK05_13950, partial [Planctomycetota bacterium]